MVCGTIRPKSNEAKRGQMGSSSASKARWAHLSQFCPQNQTNPELAKTTLGPEIGQEPQVATIQPMAFGSHQRPPTKLQARIPPSFRGRLFLPQCTPYSRIQEWCIY
ncbi:hypothetical protein O181_015002, partial [Austropuccinia psidii MF-1]|nr:hypothetical protein [Austropuccinia psidii MF-1]